MFAATTLPCVVLGGVPGPDPDARTSPAGRGRCAQPAVRGLVVGRALLYPPGGDVAAAVDAAARALRAAATRGTPNRRPSPRDRHRRSSRSGCCDPRGSLARPATRTSSLTPRTRAGPTAGCACSGWRRACPSTVTTGDERGLRAAAGRARSRVDGRTDESEATSSPAGARCSPRATDFVYVGRDSTLTLVERRAGAEVALPSARCERRLPLGVRAGRRRARRGARRRAGDPAGPQLRRARARGTTPTSSSAASWSRRRATGRATRRTSTT